MFDLLACGGHQSVHFYRDPAAQLEAIIAIHDTRRGPALGGCRCIAYPDTQAALADALRLARGMTFKAALADVPQGGGKSVVLKPAGRFDRRALFTAFGRAVEQLGGRYITAIDSGTSTADLAVVAEQTRYATSASAHLDPSPWTALGVFTGIQAAVQARLGQDNLEGVRVALQGVGHVGYPLASRLFEAGAQLLIADIDTARAEQAAADFDAQVVDVQEIHCVPCEVFAPCGLGGVLREESVDTLQCAIVAGSANNQLANPDCAVQLHARDILYAPDYVINGGGLIFASLQYNGRPLDEIEQKTLRIGDTLRALFARAQAEGVSPHGIAETMAMEVLSRSGPAPAAVQAA